jgi:uncharacterized protein DUF4386/zinc-binding dehydrogenase/alcohol dehydrogenase-like protein
MNSINKIARMADSLYFIYIVFHVFADVIGRSKLVVFGDAATTAKNIMASAWQFRIGFMIDLFAAVLFLLTAWALYILLKPVNKNLALLFLLLNLGGVTIQCTSDLFLPASQLVLSGANYLKVFQSDQLQALAMSFLYLYKNGFMIAQIFYGVWLFPLGYLVFKSGFLPRILGLVLDVAGRVEAIGRYVKQFRTGDEVFGYLPSATGRGTFAEYVCAKENLITQKPANLTFEQAAAVPVAALTALQGLHDNGNIQPGQRVLIHGASGGVGTFAVQIAKAFGARVTAVCSTRNLDMARSIGADHVIDYTREDFTRNNKQYDLIIAVNGYHPISDYLRALSPDGTYVVAGGSMLQLFQAAVHGRKTAKTGCQKVYVVLLSTTTKVL